MDKKELLQPGRIYHIYNCGINGADIFRSPEDYQHFLRLYERYCDPVCETYAWVLMKNHFHLLVKIKENVRYRYSNDKGKFSRERFNEIKWETVMVSNADRSASWWTLSGLDRNFNLSSSDEGGPDTFEENRIVGPKIPKAHLHFSHLFNAYAKYFNLKHHRHGSLFERQFKRKEVDNKRYFRHLVVYIHQNPVHHGFCAHPMDYGWSSYLTLVSFKPTKICQNEVIGWFNDVGDFKRIHEKILKIERIEDWLEL